jgi:hypothetical protein
MRIETKCIGWHGGSFATPRRRGYGFRDFQSFNFAMLAKQVWMLINNSDLLCAKVVKAKYYPNIDIPKAGPEEVSYFTWKSICCWSGYI